MQNQTVTDWLIENQLNYDQINFIETILTFTTMVKKQPNSKEKINESFQKQFPNKNAVLKPDLTYKEFTQILKDNSIEVNPIELLHRYRTQGICVNICDEWLGQL
ncbi:hypothetical protein [Ureibacillus thermosphaericus]|uniref:hypothetical protein n=1 Tax=Ureibacillus thermosphaericus TaxID=51173 RepID=UPI0030C908CB